MNQLVSRVEKRQVLTREKGTGDAIDAVLTNRWLGIPIFALVMFLVFQISQVSMVPNSSCPFSAFSRAPGTLSRIHLILVPEK